MATNKDNCPVMDDIEAEVESLPSLSDNSATSDDQSEQENAPIHASGEMIAKLFENKMTITNLLKQLSEANKYRTEAIERDTITFLQNKVRELRLKIDDLLSIAKKTPRSLRPLRRRLQRLTQQTRLLPLLSSPQLPQLSRSL